MSLLLKKYRKGVSPVIAVVLLIALTVAAAAVIWTLTSGILDDADADDLNLVSKNVRTVFGGTEIAVTLTLDASSPGTFTELDIVSTTATGVTLGSFSFSLNQTTFIEGEDVYNFHAVYTGPIPTGTYDFILKFNFGGSQETLEFSQAL